eukprot:828891-Prymnesium_polylepis.1
MSVAIVRSDARWRCQAFSHRASAVIRTVSAIARFHPAAVLALRTALCFSWAPNDNRAPAGLMLAAT